MRQRRRTFDESLLDQQVKVLLTEEHHEKLLRITAKFGINKAEYIRRILLTQMEKDEKDIKRNEAA